LLQKGLHEHKIKHKYVNIKVNIQNNYPYYVINYTNWNNTAKTIFKRFSINTFTAILHMNGKSY